MSNAELFTPLLTKNCHHFSQELWIFILKEEENNKKEFLAIIYSLDSQKQLLCRELGIRYIELGGDVPFREMEKQLRANVTSLKKDKKERMKHVRALPEKLRKFHERVAYLKEKVDSR